MAMARKWAFWIAAGGLGLALFGFMGCGPASQDQTILKARVQIPPDPKQPRLENQQMEDIFNKALSTGIQLGYRVIYANPEQGVLSLAKVVSPEHVPITLNVEIQKEAERVAYAEIIFQCPRMMDDSQLNDFKNALSAKFKKKKDEPPLKAEAAPLPAAQADKAPTKIEPAKVEPRTPPEKPPTVLAIVSKNARVRVEPNTASKIIIIFQNPTKVQKLGQSGDWVKVKLASGEIGWVYKNLVREEKGSG